MKIAHDANSIIDAVAGVALISIIPIMIVFGAGFINWLTAELVMYGPEFTDWLMGAG